MDAYPVKCTQCSKSFHKKAKLTAHMKTVHSGIKYDCDFCEKQYGSKQGLTSHKKTIHKEELHNSEIKDIEDKVDITVSNNPHSSLSTNNDVASRVKTDDQVNNAKKSNVAKKVPDGKTSENIILSKEKGENLDKKDPKIKETQKSSSKVTEKGLKKETVSIVSNLKNYNEFYVNSVTPFESKNKIEIKVESNVHKENLYHSLKDQTNHVKFTSFATDCQINHEDCHDKHFDNPDEMVKTKVEDDDKESCLWAHFDNLFVDEELEFTKANAVNAQSHLDNREIPIGITTLADDHSEEKVLELQASKGNNLKDSEVGCNASSDKPSNSTEPGLSLESLLVPKKDKKTDISLETTPEVAKIEVEEFVCETIGCKKKFTAKGDLDEHTRTADGQNRKCPLCLKDFFNEECRKYHKDQNCGVDTESDEDDEDDDSDFDVEAEEEEEWDEDEILDGPEHDMKGLKSEHEKVKDMDREHSKLDVYDNQRKPDKLVWNEKENKDDFNKDKTDKERNETMDKVEANSSLLVNDAQHSTIDGIQMPTKDVSRPPNAFIPSSPSYVVPKSESQAPTQYAQHPTKEGIQPLTNYAYFPPKDTIETQLNNVQYATENTTNNVQLHTLNVNQNSTQPPTIDVQNFTKDTNKTSGNHVQTLTNNFQHPARSVNQKSANDIKDPTKNGNQGPANDTKHPIESENQVSVNDVKYPTENVIEASSSDIQQPSGTNIVQSTDSTIDQRQTIRPGIEVEDQNKAPKEKPFSLKEKQLLYRFHQQWKQLPYLQSIPFSPEQLIQMSQSHFDNISASFIPPQKLFSKTVREALLKLPSKPAPTNFLQEKQTTDNFMQNKTIPKQMLKRKGDLVNNEPMSKKIHQESKVVKEEDEDPKLKFMQSVLRGLNLGNNNENYEVIVEDGTVKLKIIGNHESSSESLGEDNDEGSGQNNSKWKTYSDCNDRSFSSGGPTIPEGWKMCFEEQKMEGRKVMVAKYMDPKGKFYNRGQNGYNEIPNF